MQCNFGLSNRSFYFFFELEFIEVDRVIDKKKDSCTNTTSSTDHEQINMIKNVVENENVYLAELRFPSHWNSADMNSDNMLSLLFSVFRVILPQIELSSIKLN